MDIAQLRGQGRWDEALELKDDPFERADLLNEQALFTGSADARVAAGRDLVRADETGDASAATAFAGRIDAALTAAAGS